MCIKIADSEIDTVKALMSMSLNAIIADIFDLDLDEIKPELHLNNDLHISANQQQELHDTIAEYFDNLSVDFTKIKTLNDLFEVVIFTEF